MIMLAKTRTASAAPQPVDWSREFSDYGRRATASEIRELLKLLDQPGIISFAGGIPDPDLFPLTALAEAHARILGDPACARVALQYSVSEGYPPLRDWLAAQWRAQGVACTSDNILITNGSQQALDLIARLFLDLGDRLLTARPTYLGALQAFASAAPRYGSLSELSDPTASPVKRAPAKLAYVMPDFANPTGQSMSLDERLDLLAAAEAQGVTLIEDAAYVALSYDGPTPPSLLALDSHAKGGVEAGRVLHCGTFSKTVVPGLRIGWIVAPTAVIRKLVLLKQASDLHTGSLAQMVLSEIVDDIGPSHLDILRATYRARRDAMLAALQAHMPAGVSWTRPRGGMFVWVTLPDRLDGAVLLEQAIRTERVAFVPGAAFFANDPQRNTLRLNFSLNNEADIAEGLARLGRLIARS
jgi:DNA-binding transcriptional MocR family regulator